MKGYHSIKDPLRLPTLKGKQQQQLS